MDRRSFVTCFAGVLGGSALAPRRPVPFRALDAGPPVPGDDGRVIAAKLAAAGRAGGGDVRITDGVYSVTESLIVPAKVNLYLSRNVTLLAVSDVDIVRLAGGGRIDGGGTLDFSRVTRYSSAAISVIPFAASQETTHTYIGDLFIQGANQENSCGIRCSVSNPDERIAWVKAAGVDIAKAYFGLRLTAVKPASGRAWVNANRFSVDIRQPTIGISLESEGEGARTSGNWFDGQMQTYTGTQRAVRCDGEWNRFDIFVWDWSKDRAGYPVAIEMDSQSRNNQVAIPDLSQAHLVDHGKNNAFKLR